MGRDGVDGAAGWSTRGGAIVAQDQAQRRSSGACRGAVAEAGLACAVLPPDEIARRDRRAERGRTACR